MTLFRNKYRVESSRLKNWDYSNAGAYFITICTNNRDHYFGEIQNGKMQYTPVGVIADVLWHEIKNHTHNVELDAFVVMPNHIHGIIILGNDNDDADGGRSVDTLHAPVETLHATSLRMSAISPKRGSVSAIIRSYKSAVTKHAHRLGFEFSWQPRYYDHIIRDEKSFERIQQYIVNNRINWNADKFNSLKQG